MMTFHRLRTACYSILCFLTASMFLLTASTAAAGQAQWITVWATAPMILPDKYALPAAVAEDVSLRQIVHVQADGERLRFHLSNAYGQTPLRIRQATLALARHPGSADIVPGSLRTLTFSGKTETIIQPGETRVTDPIDLTLKGSQDLAITLWQQNTPVRQTGHIASHATSFALRGNHVAETTWPDATPYAHWYEITTIDTETTKMAGAIAVIGDSVTDGTGIAADSNRRWTDFLATRLAEAQFPLAVLNLGIGGNRLLRDGNGPAGVARLDRDIFDQHGVTHLILLEGVNDLGRASNQTADEAALAARAEELKTAYRNTIAAAHRRGIKVFLATIPPFGGSPLYPSEAANTKIRTALNDWIRQCGEADGVLDFDAVLRAPATPDRLRADYDSGDHLHPAPGYQAMADSIDLQLFIH